MYRKIFIIRIFFLILSGTIVAKSLPGQCPGNDSLWKRISFLANTTALPPTDKLKELQHWEKQIHQCLLPDTTKSFLFYRIGLLYLNEAHYTKAIEYIQRSIGLSSVAAIASISQSRLLIRKYYDLSRIYDSLQNVKKRITALDSCAAIADRISALDDYHLFALNTKIQYLFDIGDYHSCIRYADHCEKLGRQYAVANPNGTGMWYAFSSFGWIVNSLLRLQDYSKAEQMLENKIEECKKAGLRNYFGTLYEQLAEVMESKGEYQKALSLYNQALQYEEQWGTNHNCRVLFNNIGYVYNNRLKDYTKALYFYKRGLNYNKKTLIATDTSEMLNIAANIGSVYSQQKQFDSAFNYFQKAFDFIKKGLNENDILKLSLIEFARQTKVEYLIGLLISKSDAYLHQYKNDNKKQLLGTAINGYKIADKILDRVRYDQIDMGSKLAWRNNTRRLYEHAIDACFLQRNTTDAFYFFEKSRAVLLHDQMSSQRWMGESDILKQTELTKKIQQLENGLKQKSISSNQSTSLKNEIFSARRDLDRLEQTIKANNPLYYQNFLDTGFISLKQVQQNLLNNNTSLLEIFSGDSSVYALYVTSSNSQIAKIDKQNFENVVTKYVSFLSDVRKANSDFEGFITASSNLYKMIFQNERPAETRIIISPDGQYFPFEALVTNKTGQTIKWFLNEHAVSYTYSARFLMNDFSFSSSTGGKSFMGVAPVNFPPSYSLASLPGSDQSIKRISHYFNNPFSLSASNASRNNFLQQFSNYPLIQLYTHASGSSDNNEPVIYFADSALYLSELINEYRPQTSLIVLSACETGTGQNYKGEGVFSFNRGFAAMGIPAAITNLWSVDNTSTYKLTELFYKYISRGLPTDIALQKAKLEFLATATKEKTLPYYWAAPVLVGKVGTIELKKSHPWKWLALFAGIGMGCFVFWFVRKQRNQNKKATL